MRDQGIHPHIKALTAVLTNGGIPFHGIPSFPDAISVAEKFFIRATTPFNDEGVSALCKDKAATYKMLEGIVDMPKTRAFLDPNGRHPELCSAKSHDEIVARSLDFLYPRIVKMNQGERGKQIYFAENEADYKKCFERVFDKSSRDYDYIALAQEYVDIRFEHRVAISAGRPIFAYAKGEYEPKGRDAAIRLFELSERILQVVPLTWGSLDFLESKDGRLLFLEANTKPSYESFIEKNGDAVIRELYLASFRPFLEHADVSAQRSSNDTFGASLRRFGRFVRFYPKA